MNYSDTLAVVSDFDGTISKKDFFFYVIDNLLKEDDLSPWKEYKAGKIAHVDALNSIFSKIRLSEKDFKDFVYSLPIEEGFVETVRFCKTNDIGFFIVSAGSSYYIDLILDRLGIKNYVTTIANPGTYSATNGLQFLKTDVNSPYYSQELGVSKKKAANIIKSKYNKLLFAGDGTPDYDIAILSDIVFARHNLLKMCNNNSINCIQLNSYYQILDKLKEITC